MRVVSHAPVGRPGPPLRWLEVDASETDGHPTAVADILARRLDGMTISGVFSRAEAARAVERLERYRDETTEAAFGTMLGMPLAELPKVTDDLSDRSPYLDQVERCRAYFRDAFGFDPHDRVASVVSPLAGGLPVEPPAEGGRPYSPGNIRWYQPNLGGLPAHVGNEFLFHQDEAGSHLRSTTRTRDHLSWFVVLQPPEDGGALSVYDLEFETHTAKAEWTGPGRDDSDFDDLPAKRISPEPGGMVLFGGGWRWHRVDPVRGSRPRITYGGFAGPSTDGRALHFWF